MNQKASANTSTWISALMALECTATECGVSSPIEWDHTVNRMWCTATKSVVVGPFDISLQPGQVLEVRWSPGDTAYGCLVLNPARAAGEN
jgi:hypothetical protein